MSDACAYRGLLLSVTIAVVSSSSRTLYVRSGENITGCMTCNQNTDILNLYRLWGGREDKLVELRCDKNYSKTFNPRILLDTRKRCWTLTNVGMNDSGRYILHYHNPSITDFTTDIIVLDPVLIFNITSNFSRLGEEVAVSVLFSGEESAVTWEVDGEPIPERYRLIDDNRTLIIPSVQRDDAERRFRVRITNPVSEEIREYRLIDDPVFSKVLITEDYEADGRHRGVTAAICVAAVLIIIIIIIGIIYMKRLNCSRNRIPEIQKDALYTPVPQHNGSVPAVTERNEPEAILIQNGSAPTVQE